MPSDAVNYAKRKELAYRFGVLMSIVDALGQRYYWWPQWSAPYEMIGLIQDNTSTIDALNAFDESTKDLNLIKFSLDRISVNSDRSLMVSKEVALQWMNTVRSNSIKALAYLEYSPPPGEKETKELSEIGKEIDALENEVKDKRYTDLLKRALVEATAGHNLSAALIAAKAGYSAVSKAIGDLPKSQTREIDDEQLIQILKNKGVSINNEDRGAMKTQMIKAIKKSRDYVMHDLDSIPNAGDAYGLIGDAEYIIRMLKGLL